MAVATAPKVTRRPQHAGSVQRLRWGREFLANAVVVIPPVAVIALLGRTLTAPLWFNEQWRASFFSHLGGWVQGIQADHTTSMATGWYFIERWSGQLFGSTELALRIPTAAFLVLDCVLLLRLSRRWFPLPIACAVALVAALTTDLVNFAIQLAPYDVDTVTVVAVLLLIDSIPNDRRRGIFRYFGIGVACFFGSATVFVAAPLLALDAVRAIRRRVWWRIYGIASAGVIALMNLALQVKENNIGEYRYWSTGYPSHHGVLLFYWNGLRSFVENGLTDAHSLGPVAHASLIAAWTVFIVAGVVTVVHRRIAHQMLLAIVGSLVLTALTSALRIWPFGYTRPNTYEVPLLVILAAIGVFGVARAVSARPLGALVTLIGVGALVLAAIYEGAGIQAMTVDQPGVRWGAGVRAAVAKVRQDAAPGAAVIVAGFMAERGWSYYLFDYQGSAVDTGPPLPASHVLLEATPASRAATAFVRRIRPSEIYVYFPTGTSGPQMGTVGGRLGASGYCQPAKGATEGYKISGLLVSYQRC